MSLTFCTLPTVLLTQITSYLRLSEINNLLRTTEQLTKTLKQNNNIYKDYYMTHNEIVQKCLHYIYNEDKNFTIPNWLFNTFHPSHLKLQLSLNTDISLLSQLSQNYNNSINSLTIHNYHTENFTTPYETSLCTMLQSLQQLTNLNITATLTLPVLDTIISLQLTQLSYTFQHCFPYSTVLSTLCEINSLTELTFVNCSSFDSESLLSCVNNLRSLHLSYTSTKYDVFCTVLSQMKQLQTLTLHNISFTNEERNMVFTTIANHLTNQLKHFTLKLYMIATDFLTLSPLCTLETLEICDEHVNHNCNTVLPLTYKSSKTLKSLKLHMLQLPNSSQFLPYLTSMTNLHTLSITQVKTVNPTNYTPNNAILLTQISIQRFIELIPNLTYLNYPFPTNCTAEILLPIAQLTQLRTLYLRNLESALVTNELFYDMCRYLPDLRELYLDGSTLSPSSICFLVHQTIFNHTSLSLIDCPNLPRELSHYNSEWKRIAELKTYLKDNENSGWCQLWYQQWRDKDESERKIRDLLFNKKLLVEEEQPNWCSQTCDESTLGRAELAHLFDLNEDELSYSEDEAEIEEEELEEKDGEEPVNNLTEYGGRTIPVNPYLTVNDYFQ